MNAYERRAPDTRTPPPAISMVHEGAEKLSAGPIQGHRASPGGWAVGLWSVPGV